MLWKCPSLETYWKYIINIPSQTTNVKIPPDLRIWILGDMQNLDVRFTKKYFILLAGTAGEKCILQNWTSELPSLQRQWLNELTSYSTPEKSNPVWGGTQRRMKRYGALSWPFYHHCISLTSTSLYTCSPVLFCLLNDFMISFGTSYSTWLYFTLPFKSIQRWIQAIVYLLIFFLPYQGWGWGLVRGSDFGCLFLCLSCLWDYTYKKYFNENIFKKKNCGCTATRLWLCFWLSQNMKTNKKQTCDSVLMLKIYTRPDVLSCPGSVLLP